MNKNPLFLVVVLVLLGCYAKAQKADSSLLTKSDIHYFKNDGRLVAERDSADYIRVISPPDSSDLNLFVVRDFFMNGKPKLVGKSLIPASYLKRQGTFIEYFQNGHRKSIINYDNGGVTGDEVYYYPNGKLYYISRYDRDNRISILSEARDSTGNIIVNDGEGRWMVYDKDFKKIEGEGPITKGVKNGGWSGVVFDSIKYVCMYKDGKGTTGISYLPSGKVVQFTQAEIEPTPVGGMAKFYYYIGHTLHYPPEAKALNVQGKVFIQFVIEKDGRLTEAKVIRGIGSGCDEAALSVIKGSPRWNPGYQFGFPVRVQYNVPISFSLQEVEDR